MTCTEFWGCTQTSSRSNGMTRTVQEENGEKVQMKATHKYLGIVLSNDIKHHGYKDAKSAMVIQLKCKVKMVLNAIGPEEPSLTMRIPYLERYILGK